MNNEKFEIEWWDDWYNSDPLKRVEMVKKLSICRNIKSFIPKKGTKEIEVFSLLLNSLFEDLVDYMGSNHN